MRRILTTIFIVPLICQAQLVSLIVRNDTLFGFNPSTGVYTQYTKLVPPPAGNSGKYITTNGTTYSWGMPSAGSVAFADITGTPADNANLASALSGKQAAGTYATGTGTANGTNTGDQTTVSGNAGTATILQNTRKVNGVDFNGSADITVDNDLNAYAALGSPVLAETVNQKLAFSNTSTNMVDGQIKFEAVYLPKAATLTGIKVYVRVLGSYTGDNNNRVGLYSYSGGVLTLVASSTNSSGLWQSGANAIQTIPFSGTYAASAGLYYVGFLYNQSAQVTAPALASGVALNNLVMGSTAYGFTNSAKLHGTANGTDLTTPINMTAITSSVIPSWVALY